MKKRVFVVLKKYFYSIHGVDVPYTPDGGDILLFDSYDVAKAKALDWCSCLAEQVSVLTDVGELPDAACQIDSLVMQCLGRSFYGVSCERVVAEVYQKYVL